MAPGGVARHTRIPVILIRKAGTKAAVFSAGHTLLCLLISFLAPPGDGHAALLELRPGPIELPHYVAAADLDRDGFQDLIIANFQGGPLDLLMNQKDGTFAPHETSPVSVGIASFNNPSSGPLIVLVSDLNPEDVDSDTVANAADNCPNLPNVDQTDLDTAEGLDGICGTADDNIPLYGPDMLCGTADDLTGSSGIGNACRLLEDTDDDGIPDTPFDSDGDGVLDYDPASNTLDNCPLTPNPGQEDTETAAGPDGFCGAAGPDGACGTADDDMSLFGMDGVCGTSDDLPGTDDNPLLNGPDGICETTADNQVGDGVGDACPLSPDLVILENSVGLTSPLGIVRVRVNDGSGGMVSRPSLLTGLQPVSILLEDFDGDGFPDTVISSSDSGALQLFPGGAGGNFQPQVILESRENPQGVAAGDFNGDGDVDLVVAQGCDHSLGVYLNDGSGLPTTQTAFVSTDTPPPLLIQPNLLVAGDFDGDGDADLVVLGFEGERTCINPGGWRNGLCCTTDADCDDPDDPADDPTNKCTAGGSDQGIVQVFLGTFLCSGGPNDGSSCSIADDCADTPPDPATDGICVTLDPSPAASFLLGAGERATAALLEDFDGDGTCGGFETGNCDTGGTDTCLNAAASGEPCTIDAGCDRAVCSAGPLLGVACQQDRDCSPDDLAITICPVPADPDDSPCSRSAGGNGRVSIYPGLGNGSFAQPPADITGFVLPISLTPFDLDPSAGALPDLAVLDRDVQRTILFDNDDIAGSASFTTAPTSPASAWKASRALELQGIDLSVGVDLVLLQGTPPRLDTLSGIGNGFFRSLPSLPLEGPASGSDLLLADLRDDDRTDLVVLDTSDPASGRLTVVLNTLLGVLEEIDTVTVPGGFTSASAGSLVTDISDYDRDGVPNLIDNCPTRYNPPLCTVTDPSCRAGIACDDTTQAPTDCARTDPATAQCDSDGNGIGDHCQVLNSSCGFIDSDFDLVLDYNSTAIVLISSGVADFDRDGVANSVDNCPNLSNFTQTDANLNDIGDACEIPLELETGTCNTTIGACSFPAEIAGNPCAADSDCVTSTCTGASDTDNDGVCDYDPRALLPPPDFDFNIVAALDNCPGVPNPRRCSDDLTILCADDLDCGPGGVCAQPDTDGDHVGNACVIKAALDNCPFFFNPSQEDADDDGVGDGCALPVEDVVVVNPPAGTIIPFTGDGSGGLFPGALPPFTGFSTPSSALVGNFSLKCTGLFNDICLTATTPDVLVAETVVVGNPNDDRLTLLRGDGSGDFSTGACDTSGFCDLGTCLTPVAAAGDACTGDADCHRCDASNPGSAGTPCLAGVDCRFPVPSPTQGDPNGMQFVVEQPVCPSPQDPARPLLTFDNDAASNLIAVSQPATSTLGIFLPSNQALVGVCIGGPFAGQICAEEIDCEDFLDPTNNGICTAGVDPSLVPPPGHPAALPVPGPLTAFALDDMNNDGISDIVALSSGDGDPATPNLTIYMGIGNGLFYTDPTLNPADVPDGATLLATNNINLATDLFLPEVSLFYPPEDADGDGMLDPGEDRNGNGVLDGDAGPIVLTNILNERADFDGSGRIDGFDLVTLARSFGAVRGEDFSLVEIDGLLQFAQTGQGDCALGPNDGLPCTADLDCPGGACTNLFRRVLDNTAGSTVGTDLPNQGGLCNLTHDPMTVHPTTGEVLYGLTIDINLDGLIDGVDLAIMASLFGREL